MANVRASNALGIALAYIFGLLTPVVIYLIFYTIARVEPRVSTVYNTAFCSGLAVGTV